MINQPFAVPALILFIVAVPLALGLVPRNPFYGFRTAKTMTDDKAWYAVNRLAAVTIMLGSVVYGVVAAIEPYNRSARDNFATWGIHLVAFVLPVIIGLVISAWYSKRL